MTNLPLSQSHNLAPWARQTGRNFSRWQCVKSWLQKWPGWHQEAKTHEGKWSIYTPGGREVNATSILHNFWCYYSIKSDCNVILINFLLWSTIEPIICSLCTRRANAMNNAQFQLHQNVGCSTERNYFKKSGSNLQLSERLQKEAICNYLQSIIVCSFVPRFLKSIVQYSYGF